MTFQKVGPETWGLWQPARLGDLEESGFRGESQSRGRCLGTGQSNAAPGVSQGTPGEV